MLGGVAIPHSSGLIGHSDADVLLHAVIDAILGALGLGDVGEWFPDTDQAFKDCDSRELLRKVVEQALHPRGRIVNLDCTIFAEAPKLSPFKPAIRDSLAELVGVARDRVNVKAKTGEKVGPIGRQEALGAEVAVLVELWESADANSKSD